MNEFDYVRKKFHNKSFIEITAELQNSALSWLMGPNLDGQGDVRKAVQRVCERGFIKFIDEGVMIIKRRGVDENLRFYPFKFRDDGLLQLSIYISNPHSANQLNTLELLCKVECGLDTIYKIIDNTYNDKLAAEHLDEEFRAYRDGLSPHILGIMKEVNKDHPNLKPDTAQWRYEVGVEYFRTIIKAQILSILAINAYLTLLNKEILITRIEQKREMKAGNSGGKKSKRNPLYRYVVELPPNYKPRKFNLNYVLSHWERAGHMTTKWVLPENAEILAKRKNGRVTNRRKNHLVAIEIPVSPQMCYRKAVDIEENNMGLKQYSDN